MAHRVPSVPHGPTPIPRGAHPKPLGRRGTYTPLTMARARARQWQPSIGVVLWNGEEITTARETPVARARVRDRRTLVKLLLNMDLEFGDAYTDARVEVLGDLTAFVETAYRAEPPSGSSGFLRRLFTGQLYRPRRNSVSGSRRNIHHHYDLSNDFYRLWLDEQMVYTCAYFPTVATLEKAQVKMDHVCAGRPARTDGHRTRCGWGAAPYGPAHGVTCVQHLA